MLPSPTTTRTTMSPTTILLLLLICIYSSAVSHPVTLPAHPTSQTPTAYEVLQSYNFPIGLLPTGALGYDLDPNSGKFSAYLNGSCSFSLEGSYQLKYQPTISGLITENRLKNLRGISVKVLLFWVNIIEVVRSGEELEFSVGIASANFAVNNFDECPQCGCGVDCINLPGVEEGAQLKLRGPF